MQPDASQAEIARKTAALDAFGLTAFHEFVTLTGSWVIGYAALTGARTPDHLWDTAHIDELWQQEQWGEDEEAIETRALKREAFLTAHRFLTLSRADVA